MAVLSNPVWVARTPIITTALLEIANIQQLIRMWTEWTADGQSLWGWICVNLALCLWFNFYRVMMPGARWAMIGTAFGIAMNSAVIATVIVFRYILS